MKWEYAWSSSARWVDTTGVNQGMGDRQAIFAYARDNGWELVAVSDGVLFFKRQLS